MQEKPVISVVIPTYNRSLQLLAAISSALHQSYAVAEVLVCDDGSTDDSEKKVKALNDPRVRWIGCGRNGRPAIPRNVGIKESKGQYIAFLDSDDEWLPEKIQMQVNALVKGEFEAVCSNGFIRAGGSVTGNYSDLNTFHIDFQTLTASNYVMCSSMLVKKELLLKCGGFPEDAALKALEDYALWLRVAAYTNIYYLEEKLVLYTDEASGSIRKDSLNTQQQQALIFADFKKWSRHAKPPQKNELVHVLEEPFIIKYLNSRERKIHRLKQWLPWN